MMPRVGHPAPAEFQVASDGYRQRGRVPVANGRTRPRARRGGGGP